MTEQVHVDSKRLLQLVKAIFQKSGVPNQAAAIVADNLVESNLRGVDTHGVILVEPYVQRLKAGSLNNDPAIRKVVDREMIAVFDGDNGLGQVVGKLAMEEALAKCQRQGVGVVAVNHSNHFGAAAYFSGLAAARGCIGIVMSNASPRLAPWGGITPTYGNNPWSVAVPWQEGFPIILDIANSVVAFSKILIAQHKGEPIPDGWALDAVGRPTNDPEKAQVLLPIGGHKGYGIAFMVEVFAGILSNAAIGKDVGRYNALDGGQNAGHFFIALDIESFMQREEYNARLNYFVEQLKQAQLAPGFNEIYVPGEIEERTKRSRIESGIPLEKRLYLALNKLAGVN